MTRWTPSLSTPVLHPRSPFVSNLGNNHKNVHSVPFRPLWRILTDQIHYSDSKPDIPNRNQQTMDRDPLNFVPFRTTPNMFNLFFHQVSYSRPSVPFTFIETDNQTMTICLCLRFFRVNLTLVHPGRSRTILRMTHVRPIRTLPSLWNKLWLVSLFSLSVRPLTVDDHESKTILRMDEGRRQYEIGTPLNMFINIQNKLIKTGGNCTKRKIKYRIYTITRLFLLSPWT